MICVQQMRNNICCLNATLLDPYQYDINALREYGQYLDCIDSFVIHRRKPVLFHNQYHQLHIVNMLWVSEAASGMSHTV